MTVAYVARRPKLHAYGRTREWEISARAAVWLGVAYAHVVDLTVVAVVAWLLASLLLLGVLIVVYLAEQRRARSNQGDRGDREGS